jgi:hypothetical protein
MLLREYGLYLTLGVCRSDSSCHGLAYGRGPCPHTWCVGVDLHARHWPMMIWASPSHLVCVGVDLRAMGWLDDTGFALTLGVCWNHLPAKEWLENTDFALTFAVCRSCLSVGVIGGREGYG